MIQHGSIHHDVVIVGGGAAGISVAARLRRLRPSLDVAVIDPTEKHYYQPLWTLVGGGVTDKRTTERDQASVIPPGVTWIRDAVDSFAPDDDAVLTTAGRRVTYGRLVVAPGIQLDWGAIPGLEGNVGRDGLCSNYSYATVDSTWEAIQAFRGGRAVFTHPNTPIKCGGAPQKIMYLAAEHWAERLPRDAYEIVFCIATPKIFSVDRYAERLLEVCARHGIDVRYQHDLASIEPAAKRATFRRLDGGDDVVLEYDMMHVTPPMSAPDFVKGSPVAGPAGWVDVDKHTLRHDRYENVFALGDASNLPTSKTGAAIRKQAPVAARNLVDSLDGKPLSARYDGYTSCPLVTGYGKLVMAEFDYDLQPQETFPFDQAKERRSMYLVKKHLLPKLYWDGMLKGRA